MINAKGEWIYTNAEIAYELGISPSTVNAIGRKLFGGGNVWHWTIANIELMLEYIKSISVEEEGKRLRLLHETVERVGFDNAYANDLSMRIKNDRRISDDILRR